MESKFDKLYNQIITQSFGQDLANGYYDLKNKIKSSKLGQAVGDNINDFKLTKVINNFISSTKDEVQRKRYQDLYNQYRKGDGNALYQLGQRMQYTLKMSDDANKNLINNIAKKAALAGSQDAAYAVGQYYAWQQREEQEGMKWFDLATEKFHNAARAIAKFAEDQGDIEKAKEYYQKALEAAKKYETSYIGQYQNDLDRLNNL